MSRISRVSAMHAGDTFEPWQESCGLSQIEFPHQNSLPPPAPPQLCISSHAWPSGWPEPALLLYSCRVHRWISNKGESQWPNSRGLLFISAQEPLTVLRKAPMLLVPWKSPQRENSPPARQKRSHKQHLIVQRVTPHILVRSS